MMRSVLITVLTDGEAFIAAPSLPGESPGAGKMRGNEQGLCPYVFLMHLSFYTITGHGQISKGLQTDIGAKSGEPCIRKCP